MTSVMSELLDKDDERYVISFPITASTEAKSFFDEYGFVVWRDIFTAQQCEESRQAMWSIVEESNPGLKENDPLSWDKFKSSGKYGLSSRGPTFHPTLVNNRQNPNLALAIATVIETDTLDVMVSHDRYTIYRATDLGDRGIDGEAFRTGRANIHIDLNPWWYFESSNDVIVGIEKLQYNDPQDFVKENNLVVGSMGCHVQCILNFSDNLREDGGTLVVPRFNQIAAQWATDNAIIRKPLPWVQFPSSSDGSPLEIEQKLLDAAIRVSMREGSVLMWNQVVAHGTSPNFSRKCRTAQFLKAFSRRKSFQDGYAECATAFAKGFDAREPLTVFDGAIHSDERKDLDSPAVETETVSDSLITRVECGTPICRLMRRSKALQTQLQKSGASAVVTPLGKSLFGLNCLPNEWVN